MNEFVWKDEIPYFTESNVNENELLIISSYNKRIL